jgi:glycosyltransferase involved in cell wall biosynthesis
MRLGQNPAKSIQHVEKPKQITVAVVTYIPFLGGYYAQSLDVLKASLNSLWQHTDDPFDLLVFDNGSDEQVRTYLRNEHQQGRIQYLVLSEQNIGKGGAWNFIFGAAPGEYIVYADNDIYFRRGWLSRSLEVLNTYPNVGMVTGRPLRSKEQYYSSTLAWANDTPEASLQQGKFLDWDIFSEHLFSCGVSIEQTQEWFAESHDWKLDFKGVRAYAGAAHFQFLARKSILQALLPFQMDRPMGQVRALDEILNDRGYLRLMTSDPLVVHMGNTLMLLEGKQMPQPSDEPSRRRLLHWPPIKKVLMFLYNRIFQVYFGQSRENS